MHFDLTAKQQQANALLASRARHILLFGGSRSGKTFLILRAMIARAVKAPGSRHAILRFRLNHLVASILHDTWPKVLEECFPDMASSVKLDKQALFATLPNGSQMWFGGLDDKERVEKVLGQEHASIFLNECSQISYEARNVALTRLAQQVKVTAGQGPYLSLRMYYDCNPPSKAHWSYRLFFDGVDPVEQTRLADPELYGALQMNPQDNAANLAGGYLDSLQALPLRLRKRFLMGEYADANPNALWNEEDIERWRVMDGELPDLQRVVIGVDPSGADEDDAADHDAIGIVVVGLGTDGVAYVLEDLTLQAGPARWGRVVATAFDRHSADRVIGEVNYGGAMVEHVVKAARAGTPFRKVTASRGKVIRAEPVSALYEDGRVRHVGDFPDLERELCAFSTTGYSGDSSPNRADALIWALTDLFPSLTSGFQATQEHGAQAAHVHSYQRKRVRVETGTTAWVV